MPLPHQNQCVKFKPWFLADFIIDGVWVMGSVKRLAEQVHCRLNEVLPKLRKTVVSKLALVVGAMIEKQTPNTVELANLLPLDTERQDMREQWLRRLLKNPLLDCATLTEPFARQELLEAGKSGQTILLSMDQTDVGDSMALLMIGLRIGDRALPLAWCAATGAANIGFEQQEKLLELVLSWLPVDAKVMLLADRFYPSSQLFEWLQRHHWQYRLRLKGNLCVDTGVSNESTTDELAHGVTERYLPNVRLFGQNAVMTHIGILHEASHPEPWIIAMDCLPSRSKVSDYSERWGIEPMFSDFKSRGFELEDSKLKLADRLERMVLIMALAMYWCVCVGRTELLNHPTPLEKKAQEQTNIDHWRLKKLYRSLVSLFKRGLRRLMRCLQNDLPLPVFCEVMRN